MAVKSSVQVNVGHARQLGANLTDTGCNFAVFCTNADAVILCLYRADTEELINEISLPGKTGDIWHGEVAGIVAGQFYAYRVERGANELHGGSANKLLIDPYAKKLSRAIVWNARQYTYDSQFMIPKAVVVDEASYRRTITRPFIPSHQRIIYEAHIKGISQLRGDIPEFERGSYIAACHPSIIEHLKALGVTSIQFMPLASFMPEPYCVEKGLTNYWGYNPVNFFAPEPRYGRQDALNEVCQMVDAYHAAGIEVIVDVVFNHTAEGGEGGSMLSFKGFSSEQSYLFEQTKQGEVAFSNHSGCGNTVNSASAVMTRMIMDAMRFWVDVIGVDGFRFDLAACLGRDPHHFTPNAGLLRAINQDPVLQNCVLIAEPWDIGPDGYQLGNFPPPWLEVNDKFRDTVRAFWRGDDGQTADFATRLMGSRDVFAKGVRQPNTSVNNVTYHDGFTLHDLVSYAKRHNEANEESNKDGHGHNLSANYGEEGETTNEKILSLRERQKRNLFATLILAQGTPHILGGDELSRTQKGNNNAYCQDNEISWVNWDLNKRKQDFFNFCQYVIKLRQQSDLLSQVLMKDDSFQQSVNVASINWYKPDGSDKVSADWQATHNKAFGLEIIGEKSTDKPYEHWFIGFNASDNDVRFNLPIEKKKGGWMLHLDTRYCTLAEQPRICIQRAFLQAGKSLAVFSWHAST
ncbi:glycogen debranching protein GlgX [Alteromonas sp. ASW11-130]|uniref:glycogen debranching protein GlgX n=1 Tax=Alteromonas sp. ASW11-130 TaxID=3015775 RepID=UPI002241872C|nr:glycogen debranching protein GlgX [Alteromonas sp. ASW11-130]MCW8092076.1 glycogen debranching protein GlgX [Alteromonas sp. ASW11-130]